MPVLIIGIVANIAVLIAISIFTLLDFVATSIALDNHHSHNVSSTKQLKAGIASIVDTLGVVIQSLGLLTRQLAQSIDEFQQENKQLTAHIDALSKQITKLSTQVSLLMTTEQQLRNTADELEQTITTLKTSAVEQTELLEKTQKKLEQVTHDYEQNTNLLSEKIIELNTVKYEMGLEVEQAKNVGLVLQAAVDTLSNSVILDTTQRLTFHEKLNEFLTNKEASFDLIAERIFKAERELEQVNQELVLVKEQFKSSNERYKELLDKQEQQMLRLQRLNNLKGTTTLEPQKTEEIKPSNNGFYAIKKKPFLYGEEDRECTMTIV